MKTMHTGLLSAAAVLLAASALAAPQNTSGSGSGSGTSASSTAGSSGSSLGGQGSQSRPGSSSDTSARGSTSGSSGMAGSASGAAQLSSADRDFIKEAASAGMLEVEASRLAERQAQDSSAKSFARQMVQDHGRNNQKLMSLASSKGVEAPKSLDSKHQAMLDKLQRASGSDFDEEYGKLMEKSHSDTVKSFQRAQNTVKDPELKAYIAQTLPTLQSHHRTAQALPGAKGSKQATAGSESGRTSSSSRGDYGTTGGSSTGGSSSMGGSSTSGGSSMGGSSTSGGSSMGGSSTGSGSMGGSSSMGGSTSTTPGSGSGSTPGSSSSTTPPGSTTSSDTESPPRRPQ